MISPSISLKAFLQFCEKCNITVPNHTKRWLDDRFNSKGLSIPLAMARYCVRVGVVNNFPAKQQDQDRNYKLFLLWEQKVKEEFKETFWASY